MVSEAIAAGDVQAINYFVANNYIKALEGIARSPNQKLLMLPAGWQWRRTHPPRASDQPLLNRRGEQLVGRVYPLDTAIVDGRGRLKIGDAFWAVEGVDLAAGARVRVIAVDGMTLRVVAAD
jgi:membrane protein implicated in regulation of membrane protease activity